MWVIGITGKSGSGKTTLAKKLSINLNYKHYDIDKEYYTVIETSLYNETKILFGNVFDECGKLINRQQIGDKLFSQRNNSEIKNYCQKAYELLCEKILKEIDEAKYDGYILDHILLPHESKLWNICGIKVLLKIDDSKRLERIKLRDSINDDYLQLRESASITYNESEFNLVLS